MSPSTRRPPMQDWVGLASAAAMIVLDLAVPIILAVDYPGYSIVDDTISTLSTRDSPVRWSAAAALGASGVAALIYATWARSELGSRERSTRWFVGGVASFGVGTIIAAVAPEDLPRVAETASGRIHGIASALGFAAIMMSLALAWWIRELRPVRRLVAGLFVVAVVTFTLFLASENATAGWLAPTGLYQRANLLAIYAGLLIVAWHLGPQPTQRA